MSRNDPQFATIQISLNEVLLPSEVQRLLDRAQREGVSAGEVIVLAVREYLRSQSNPSHNGTARPGGE